jgi:hypothetical protein
VRFHTTGKVALDHIYTQPDPRAYFGTLRALDYRIPQLAKPYFMRLIQGYRRARQVPSPVILDVGCSYGINAALLKCNITMHDLYERYDGRDAGVLTRDALLVRDRELVRSRNSRAWLRFVGLDTSAAALSYALSAGFVDAAVRGDFEEHELTDRHQEQIGGTDLVISTGCIGYVTERTISRLLSAFGERMPWMAHFVLRMYPYDSVAERLTALGYETVQLGRVFKQRRFASAEEQSLVLDTLATIGVDPRGLEADGWLYAQLHVSRPRGPRIRTILDLAASTGTSQSPNR